MGIIEKIVFWGVVLKKQILQIIIAVRFHSLKEQQTVFMLGLFLVARKGGISVFGFTALRFKSCCTKNPFCEIFA